MGLSFPNSFAVSHRGFEVEVVVSGCRDNPTLLGSLEEEVLEIAARSRGWIDDQGIRQLRAHFKLGPLYDANSLVLIRRNGKLVGLAGTVNDWHLGGCSILHVCSLGLLPEVQLQGFLPVLMAMVFVHASEDSRYTDSLQRGGAFVTAITQSPYLYAMFHRICNLHPSPDVASIPKCIQDVAQGVVARFDPEHHLDREHLILRNECRFFYKKTPYSVNRKLNAFCDRNLSYRDGDVFVLVGALSEQAVTRYISRISALYPALFDDIASGLRSYAHPHNTSYLAVRETSHV